MTDEMQATIHDVLAGMNEIEWASYEHAYGPAGDVPNLIASLCSSDSETREKALQILYGNVVHQGTVWEVTPYVATLLVTLLNCSDLPDPVLVSNYLRSLVAGECPAQVEEEEAFDPELHVLGMIDKGERHSFALQLTRKAVADNLQKLHHLSSHPLIELRINYCLIADSVGFGAQERTIINSLMADSAGLVRVAAWRVFVRDAIATSNSEELSELIEKTIESDPEAIVKIELSRLKLSVLGDVSEKNLRRLFSVFSDDTGLTAEFEKLPWCRGPADLWLFHELCAVEDTNQNAALKQRLAHVAIDLLQKLSVYSIPGLLSSMFTSYFGPVDYSEYFANPKRELLEFDTLPQEIKAVLVVLGSNRELWLTSSGSELGNIGSSLRPRRLPHSYKLMAKYIS